MISERRACRKRVARRDRSWRTLSAETERSSSVTQTIQSAKSNWRSFRRTLESRAGGKPLQYITGHQEFFGLDFEVTSDVLIPRPETELLVETALKLVSNAEAAPFICDVGTGSGCVAITLLHELRQLPNRADARAVAIDISEAALAVAKRNAERHSVTERISFVVSDCFAALDHRDQGEPWEIRTESFLI